MNKTLCKEEFTSCEVVKENQQLKENEILHLEQQIKFFKEFMNLNRKKQLEVIKRLEMALEVTKKVKD